MSKMQPNIQQFIGIYNFFSNTEENSKNTSQLLQVENLILEFYPIDSKLFKQTVTKCADIFEIIKTETGGEPKTVISALLYVISSEFPVINERLESVFGSETAQIVFGTLKLRQLKLGRIEKNADNYIKLSLTYVSDVRSMLVRLAEIVYKIRHINEQKFDNIDLFINNISMLYGPVAHRLGLYKMKTEIEEAVMKHNVPDMYKLINEKLASSKEAREKYIESFIKPINKRLDDAGLKYKIKGRTKAISSIWTKIQKQGVGFEKVKDIFAIRIILDSSSEKEKSDCWSVYSIITDMYTPDARRMRDWISRPRSSGYESLHATILGPADRWVEVQIRTERMDEIAENGPAAHWRYKEKGKSENSNWLAHMRNALEHPDLFSTDEELLQKIQSNEIYIFTPAGELKRLEKGYTVLDFAYTIHSNLGETCVGAEVDGQFKPISYTLENGQTVKIKTSKSQTPNEEWLKILKSSKARLKLKRALKEIEFKYAEIGKELVKKKLEQLNIPFADQTIERLMQEFGAKHPIELYHKFGEGKISPLKIKPALESETKYVKEQDEPPVELPDEVEDTTPTGGDFILIDKNLTTVDYHFAKCCNPVPGDKIFGFVTVSKGTKIHKDICPNASDLKDRYPYRVIPARWNISSENRTAFIAEFIISGEDKKGLSAEISNLITNELGFKLRAISFSVNKKNQFSGRISIEIRQNTELDRIVEALKRKPYIHSIKRN